MSETQRFQRFGRVPSIDDVIKDCRDLESEVSALRKQVEELVQRINALEQK